MVPLSIVLAENALSHLDSCNYKTQKCHLTILSQKWDLDEVIGLGRVPPREESIGCAALAISAGPANPVDIIFGVVWVVEVDHELDVVYIQTSGSNVGSNLEMIFINWQKRWDQRQPKTHFHVTHASRGLFS